MSSFEQHRKLLWSIAYRMLGSASEAEDVVQETYLRSRSMPEEVASERAYLSSIVTRLCLDHWKSARVRRESYVGPWLPEPVRTDSTVDPSSISFAFMVLLESLSPLERAVYLLGQVFDYTHAEIAAIVGRDEAACRQLMHRARERIVAQRPRFAPSRESHRRLLEGFQAACERGDLAALENLLAQDAVSVSDGGGQVHAARRPVHGATRVAKLYVGLFRKARSATFEIVELNALPTLVVRIAGTVRAIVDIETDGTRILAVRNIANPQKLAHVTVQSS
jgi:RNA polymerase sigma-70 factor (ECF subfamily)